MRRTHEKSQTFLKHFTRGKQAGEDVIKTGRIRTGYMSLARLRHGPVRTTSDVERPASPKRAPVGQEAREPGTNTSAQYDPDGHTKQ